MADNQTKKKCERCLGYFPEAEMDLENGMLLCNSCEQELFWDDWED